MSAKQDPAKVLASMVQAGQEWMRRFAQNANPGAASGSDAARPAGWEIAGKQLPEVQRRMLEQMTAFWSNQGGLRGGEAGHEDPRFAAAAWREHPHFDLIRRAYLTYSTLLHESLDRMPLGEPEKAQARFAVRQLVDAMSPTNFFATNPEAIELALETGGRSLVEGMTLFLEDLGKGRVSMSDESAFEVGKNLAATPGSVVFENDLIQLIQYAPMTDAVYERPLLIVPPCINKFYILDLQPETSFVRYAVEQGHTVFVVSWRDVTPDLGHLTWDDYLQRGVMQAIHVARDICGQERVNVLGFCIGGTLSACAAAIMATNDERKIESLTLLTTMLDFAEPGELGLLVTEESVALREAQIGGGGVLQGKELAFTFSSLRANDLVWQYVANSYLKGKVPPAFDLLHWNSDSTNLPGPMFCWYLRNAYLENNLAKPGKTLQCGVPVDFGEIYLPAFIYASREDHIVPWRTAYRSGRLFSGETTFVLGASGHVAGVINPPAKRKRSYWIGGHGVDDPEQWLARAKSVAGSWWPHWSEWLATQAGERTRPRTRLGNEQYEPIEAAPGRYVRANVG
jgi:polyhydroxyalkanoate synthase subunit PhaC